MRRSNTFKNLLAGNLDGMPGALVRRSVSLSTVRAAGNYTAPRTMGSKRLSPTQGTGRTYRCKNHPIRQREPVREHGAVHLEALFAGRSDAVELAALLPGRHKCGYGHGFADAGHVASTAARSGWRLRATWPALCGPLRNTSSLFD